MCVCVLVFLSCNKDEDFSQLEEPLSPTTAADFRTDIIDDNYDGLGNDAPMVLGDTIPNPYNVNTMKQAFDLFNQVIEESPFAEKEVTASHYYVRIVLNSIQDLEIIYDIEETEGPDAPVFHMYPLHLEILQPGDYYYELDTNAIMATGTVDMSEHPIYTVIESDYVLPASLSVEILDELYKPTHEEHIVKLIAYQLAGWHNHFGGFGLPGDMETLLLWVSDYPDFQGFYPPGFVPDPPAPGSGGNNGGGTGFHSNNTHGRVTLRSNHPNDAGVRPVVWMPIQYGRFIWWHRTQTNEDGWFATHKRYNGTIYVRADWRYGNSAASIRERLHEKLGMLVPDHLMKIRNGALSRIKFIERNNNRQHVWNKATIHNGLMFYNQYCATHGIPPVMGAVVWSMPRGNAASNPMLNRMELLPTIASFSGFSEIDTWTGLWQQLMAVHLNYLIQILSEFVRLPDQIYGLDGNRRNTDRIHQTVFHESAHFSHAMQVGTNYWANVYSDQLKNGIFINNPRGNGVQPTTAGGQRIALVEGWADLADVIISLHYYEVARITSSKPGQNGLQNQIIVLDNLEDFHVHDVPVDIDIFLDRGWLLHGLMWDLLDDEVDDGPRRRTGDGDPLNFIEDNVFIGNPNNLFDLSPIFYLLTSGVENAADLRTAVLNAYPAQTAEINALFDSYGY